MKDADFREYLAANGHPPDECVCVTCRRRRLLEDGLKLSGERLEAAQKQIYEFRDLYHAKINAHEANKDKLAAADKDRAAANRHHQATLEALEKERAEVRRLRGYLEGALKKFDCMLVEPFPATGANAELARAGVWQMRSALGIETQAGERGAPDRALSTPETTRGLQRGTKLFLEDAQGNLPAPPADPQREED